MLANMANYRVCAHNYFLIVIWAKEEKKKKPHLTNFLERCNFFRKLKKKIFTCIGRLLSPRFIVLFQKLGRSKNNLQNLIGQWNSETKSFKCQISWVKFLFSKFPSNYNLQFKSRSSHILNWFHDFFFKWEHVYSVWHLVRPILLKRNLFSKGFTWSKLFQPI